MRYASLRVLFIELFEGHIYDLGGFGTTDVVRWAEAVVAVSFNDVEVGGNHHVDGKPIAGFHIPEVYVAGIEIFLIFTGYAEQDGQGLGAGDVIVRAEGAIAVTFHVSFGGGIGHIAVEPVV